MHRLAPLIVALLLLVSALGVSASAAATGPGAPAPEAVIETTEQWVWPVGQDVRVVRGWEPPSGRYGPGHRGIDLAADAGPVIAPASGVVAFVGVVVDRPLITIDHGDGLVTTLEPVASDLATGDAVARGQEVGVLSSGGHTERGAVHFGVRLDGEYINPLLLLGGVPRSVLLPCC